MKLEGSSCWRLPLTRHRAVVLPFPYRVERISRLKCTIYQKKDCAGTSENGINFLYTFPLRDGYGKSVQSSSERPSWGDQSLWESTPLSVRTHTCIFMRLLLKVHTNAHTQSCTWANTITHNIFLSHTETDNKTTQSIKIFMLQIVTFQVNPISLHPRSDFLFVFYTSQF